MSEPKERVIGYKARIHPDGDMLEGMYDLELCEANTLILRAHNLMKDLDHYKADSVECETLDHILAIAAKDFFQYHLPYPMRYSNVYLALYDGNYEGADLIAKGVVEVACVYHTKIIENRKDTLDD